MALPTSPRPGTEAVLPPGEPEPSPEGGPSEPSNSAGRPPVLWLPARAALIAVGTIALVLGVIGIVVPVLPTTPFVLLAAACYARASDRLYAKLLGQPALGPIISEWRRSRALPAGVRTRALVLVTLTFGVSITLVDGLILRGFLVVVGVVLVLFLYRIPVRG